MAPPAHAATRAPMLWGVVVGALQAATPLAFWWLDSATVYALGLAVIAAIYVGFAVADGRPKVIAVETSGPTSSRTRAGGRRSAWSSTGSSPRSSPARSPRA
jgi:hypothetical protein